MKKIKPLPIIRFTARLMGRENVVIDQDEVNEIRDKINELVEAINKKNEKDK